MGFWSIALFLLFGVIFYVGWRGRQAFAEYIRPGYGKLYWVFYLVFAFSFILFQRLGAGQKLFFSESLTWMGGYSLAFLFYAFFFLIFIDIGRVMDKWLGFLPKAVKQSPAKTGITVVLILVIILAYGTWNALHPVFQNYEINIPKSSSKVSQLNAIMISDLHLGDIVNNERLSELVNQINQRNPDIVLLVGDVIDGDIGPFIDNNMGATLAELKPRLGTYMVLGNHDGHGQNAIPYVEAAGVKVLNDQYNLIDSSFYLVGRGNRGHQVDSTNRLKLAEVMSGINRELPIILMDHNPSNLEEALDNGVDLQLSGHTHQGQMFPNNFITMNMYEIDWGYLRRGSLQVIVSNGFGTWGPPIRIGNTPEIVDLRIKFN